MKYLSHQLSTPLVPNILPQQVVGLTINPGLQSSLDLRKSQ